MTLPDPAFRAQALPAEPADRSCDPSEGWFRHAVFYEVLVRGFYDANDDGTGDLPGVRAKLDYLQWLGIDCLWLLPFMPSPLRDGGYDVTDFFNVHPDYGTLGDLVALLEDAHRRGIRVIADLVMNHTSDQHPWFVESRSSRTNPKADWYVWNDDDQRWPEARVVFTDVERSNWTWDDTRQQYYWHRFYSHQPDLNYENPQVAETMLDLVRFWLDLGFDGFRLDAVPYLFQRDGTAGEHLPETHSYIRRIRKQLEADYPGRILLAEANGWPADVADYFGTGDECHLCFHFPLMPRLFMAVRREQRYPVTEILSQTPAIPDGCQWAIFLRNHDELTLEQVSDEERDYLIAEYAKDPRMKRHMGIGRRLAPLLDGDRRLAELLHALLLSLPGSPVLYYGDELLMGDNIYLGDRDSVRTPMQWSPDRNGGFSRADFAQLYLPPLMDPVYGFGAVNVEAQVRNPSSFLHWLRGMLVKRRSLPVLGIGELDLLDCPNPSVLAFVRWGEVADVSDGTAGVPGPPPVMPTVPTGPPVGEALARIVPADPGAGSPRRSQAVLCVHNLSRFAQPAELRLAAWAGWQPVEVLGGVGFPRIGDEPYTLTLGPHGFHWFELDEPAPGLDAGPRASARSGPDILPFGGARSAHSGPPRLSVTHEEARVNPPDLADPTAEQRGSLQRILARWCANRPGGATAGLTTGTEAPPPSPDDVDILTAEVLVPGRPALVDVLATIGGRLAHAVLCLRHPGDETHVVGTVDDPVLGMVEDGSGMGVALDALHDAQAAGMLLAVVTGAEQARPGPEPVAAASRRHQPERGAVTVVADGGDATTVAFPHRCTLTVFPWPRPGPHPAVTFLAALDEAGFNHLAAPIAIWRRTGRDLGVVQEALAGAASGRAIAETSLRDLFGAGVAPETAGSDFAPEARALGTMAARMHLALDRAFGRRPGDLAAWAEAIGTAVEGTNPPPAVDVEAVRGAVAVLRETALHPATIRTHGDFHLERTARTDLGWVLADCMPAGTDPVSEDPVFRSPLADLADMAWSLGQVAEAVAARRAADAPRLADLPGAWAQRNRRSLLAGYLSVPGIGGLVPADRNVVRRAVALFEAAREVHVRAPAVTGR